MLISPKIPLLLVASQPDWQNFPKLGPAAPGQGPVFPVTGPNFLGNISREKLGSGPGRPGDAGPSFGRFCQSD